ncbi:MAG: AsmA-like C-terminal region-containing protein [Candidatus Acidiferrum sp.]
MHVKSAPGPAEQPETQREFPPDVAVGSPLKSVPPTRRRWLWIGLGVLIGGMTAGVMVLASHWPYSENVLIPALQETFKAKVSIQQFHRFYFPHPGCESDGLALTRGPEGAGEHPVATVQRMRITGRYSDLFLRPHHLAHIRLDGLYVRIPPKGQRAERNESGGESTTSETSIGSVSTHDSVLEFASADGNPLKFQIHKLTVESIAAGKAMSYDVSMRIPEPPGELESEGTFGPWQSGQIGKIALQGNVTLRGGVLDKYAGIGGTVESEDKFSGTLEQIAVAGTAKVPDFVLKSAHHRVGIGSQYQVMVNGLAGEVQLSKVTANVEHTTLNVWGRIGEGPQGERRSATLDFNISRGRVEDLLWLFSSAAKPAMMGNAAFSGHVLAPKFGDGFLKAIVLNGKFEVRDGHFQKPAQGKVNELSARASDKKVQNADDAPAVAVENLSSDVAIKSAVAHLSKLYFQVPAARARVDGTYNLLNYRVDLRGDLWTDSEVSQDESGIKAVLLKPVDPLFRRKHAGAMVAIEMDGVIDQPHFGTALTKNMTAWKDLRLDNKK